MGPLFFFIFGRFTDPSQKYFSNFLNENFFGENFVSRKFYLCIFRHFFAKNTLRKGIFRLRRIELPWPSFGSLGTLQTIALCWCSYLACPEDVSISSWVWVSIVPKNLSIHLSYLVYLERIDEREFGFRKVQKVYCKRKLMFDTDMPAAMAKGRYRKSQERNLAYSICMYWVNFWLPVIHVQQYFFEKTLTEVGSSHLYASFSSFFKIILLYMNGRRSKIRSVHTYGVS